MSQYQCKVANGPLSGIVSVPGSKSMTNRALLMAAMAKGKSKIQGVLFSDDTHYFLESLKSLGYRIHVDEENHCVTIHGKGKEIPKKRASIYVGSAGTAARFLTAMLGVSEGDYEIQCSDQMKRRPMGPLIKALRTLGATVTCLEEEGFLPVRITNEETIFLARTSLDISKSTQFLSALLMVAPLLPNGIIIDITSEKKRGSYIDITMNMMKEYGVIAKFVEDHYVVDDWQEYKAEEYQVEPDMSAACYFYGIAAITGGSVIVEHIHPEISQGDKKFLSVLESMGCLVADTKKGICVTGPKDGHLKGIKVNMNDFSDQSLTLAAIAPFTDSGVEITNIAHVRGQESDRIRAMANALTAMGIEVEERQDGLLIHPGTPRPAIIDTVDDHRMAMAFSLCGLKAKGIVIDNPECCRKTFKEYFKVLDAFLEKNG